MSECAQGSVLTSRLMCVLKGIQVSFVTDIEADREKVRRGEETGQGNIYENERGTRVKGNNKKQKK